MKVLQILSWVLQDIDHHYDQCKQIAVLTCLGPRIKNQTATRETLTNNQHPQTTDHDLKSLKHEHSNLKHLSVLLIIRNYFLFHL